jgi:hypothetical protein
VDWQGKPKFSDRKPAPAPLLSITKSHMTRPGLEPGPPRWEAGDYYFFYLVYEAIGTAATPGLLCQPRVIVKMIVQKQMEYRLCRGNRSSRRKRSPAPLLSITKSHMTRPGFDRRGGKPATNRLSYGAAIWNSLSYN